MILNRPTLGVFGTWRAPGNTPLYEEARQLGRIAAQHGYVVVTGGYSGIMEAAPQGAFETGGTTVGIVCQELNSSLAPNPYLTEVILENDFSQRMVRILALTDYFVFFPGRTGTAGELVFALDMISKKLKESPLLLWGDFWYPFLEALDRSNAQLPYSSDGLAFTDFCRLVRDPVEAMAILEQGS